MRSADCGMEAESVKQSQSQGQAGDRRRRAGAERHGSGNAKQSQLGRQSGHRRREATAGALCGTKPICPAGRGEPGWSPYRAKQSQFVGRTSPFAWSPAGTHDPRKKRLAASLRTRMRNKANLCHGRWCARHTLRDDETKPIWRRRGAVEVLCREGVTCDSAVVQNKANLPCRAGRAGTPYLPCETKPNPGRGLNATRIPRRIPGAPVGKTPRNKSLWRRAGSAIRAANCDLTSIAMGGNKAVPFTYGEAS